MSWVQVRHPRVPTWRLGLWLVLMAWGLWSLTRAHFSADLSAFLPGRANAQQQLLIDQVQSGAVARTLMVGIEGGDAAARAQVSKALASRLRDSGQFVQVLNGDRQDWTEVGEWLIAHRYVLSPAMSEAHFSVAGLRASIDDTVSLLGTPAGSLIKPLLERDPTGEVQRVAESLMPAQSPRMEAGVWSARELPRALLLLTTRAEGGNLDAQSQALAAVREAFVQVQTPGLHLRMSGPPTFAVDSRAQIEREVRQLAMVGAVVMGGVLYLAFASLRALAVAFVPVMTGLVAGTVAVSLCFDAVHGITLGFGSTLIGEAVDYAIYYLIQARARAHEGAQLGPVTPGWQRWRDEGWPTVRLGLWTSTCGFAALVFSGFPGLAQLGVFSIAGLLAAAVVTRFVLPVMMPDGACGQGWRPAMGWLAGRLVVGAPRARGVVWLGVVVAILWLGWVAATRQPQGLWRGGLSDLSPVPSWAQALDTQLRADLNASDARVLIVAQGVTEDQALRRAELAGERLDVFVSTGRLAGFDTPTRVLPSVETQQARLASLPDAQTLRARLAEAMIGGPLASQRLAPFVADVQAVRAQAQTAQAVPLRRADLPAQSLRPVVDALLVTRPQGGATALLPVQAVPGQAVPVAALRVAMQAVPGVEVLDIKAELDALYAHYLREALWQSALGAVAVVVLLAFHLRSMQRLWAVCQPLVAAAVLTLGGLSLTSIPLGILHLVGLLLVVAVGSNYALFFDQWRQRQHVGTQVGRVQVLALQDTDALASLLLANLTTVLSFGLIALSGIPALSAMGQVVAPGAALALWLSAVFARGR